MPRPKVGQAIGHEKQYRALIFHKWVGTRYLAGCPMPIHAGLAPLGLPAAASVSRWDMRSVMPWHGFDLPFTEA